MAEEAIKAVVMRNQFYRDSYRRVLLVLLLSVILNLGLGGVLYYMVSNPPKPQYFATSINGRITPLSPLDQPNQSDSAILQWANLAAISAYSYNFVNYRQELQAASGFFTPKGWQDFLKALQDSNTLDAVRAKKLIVSAVATQAPIILVKGILDGRYAWRVQMRLLATFQSASEFQQQSIIVTMLITRVSTLNNPRGIGIQQFIAQPATGGQ